MKIAGQILKEKRESLNISLVDVYKNTLIQEYYIRAIEDGNEAAFSANIYYKNFVKSYAKYLGIDPKSSIEGIEERKKVAQKQAVESLASGRNNSGNRNTYKIVLFVLSGVILLSFLFFWVKSRVLLKQFECTFPLTADNFYNSNAIYPEIVKADKEHKESEIEDEKFSSVEDYPVCPQFLLRKSIDYITNGSQKVYSAYPKKPKIWFNIFLDVDKVSEETSAVYEKQNVVARAVSRSWVLVKADGREVFSGILNKDDSMKWEADSEFFVQVGYVPGVELFFNGERVDVGKNSINQVGKVVLLKSDKAKFTENEHQYKKNSQKMFIRKLADF
ncbi:MAG: DUF4115 domain-containing protein [Elusimicrobiota bacterium]|jgi:hypothetical protein|nr:DUF4115 domain-containing protein [Elusimicrobiota bacterium]